MHPDPFPLVGLLALQTGLLSWTLRPVSRAQPIAAASAAGTCDVCSCEDEVRDLLDLTKELHWYKFVAGCLLGSLILTWLAVVVSCCGACCSTFCCRKAAFTVAKAAESVPAVANRTPALALTDEPATAVYTPKRRKQ